jgi:hypothetical protein
MAACHMDELKNTTGYQKIFKQQILKTACSLNMDQMRRDFQQKVPGYINTNEILMQEWLKQNVTLYMKKPA